LYARAIAESNPAGLIFRTLTDDEKYFGAIVRDTLCGNASNPAVMECLRQSSSQLLLAVQTVPEYLETFTFPIRSREGLAWEPVIDGDLLMDQPLTLIVNGKHNTQAQVIFGTVKNETNGFLSALDLSSLNSVEYGLFLKAIFSTNVSSVLKQYPPMGTNSLRQLNVLLTDYLFVCPVRFISRFFQKFALSPNSVYVYNFLYTPEMDPDNPVPQCENAACHSVELEYVFDSRTLIPGNFTFSSSEQLLSDVISGLWTTFAAEGVPSHSSAQGENITWPAFTADNNEALGLNVGEDGVSPLFGYDYSNCNYWDSVGYIY